MFATYVSVDHWLQTLSTPSCQTVVKDVAAAWLVEVFSTGGCCGIPLQLRAAAHPAYYFGASGVSALAFFPLWKVSAAPSATQERDGK